MMSTKLPVEDDVSWALHLESETVHDPSVSRHRRLKKHEKKLDSGYTKLEAEREAEFMHIQEEANDAAEVKRLKKMKKREKRMKELYADPGIQDDTTHGIVIDAGSGGSRLHIYEWEPRVLRSFKDVEETVSGQKISFPGSKTRWTDRLSPGISTFSSIESNDELEKVMAEYLEPLLGFATTVLHEKRSSFAKFPIYLRATAGMRLLEDKDRSRIINVVRKLFHNDTFCPFYFQDEQARTLSGEEEAIFDWLGVNFLASNGEILHDSAGTGTVTSPRQTYGALDLGGASTQISFYEPNEDIMANLFKLQIGQGKHWNVYTHSFLEYGINEATNRFEATLTTGKTMEERLVEGLYNPCLPGGSTREVRLNIHTDDKAMETRTSKGAALDETEFYQAVFNNLDDKGDFHLCNSLVHQLLHTKENRWCEFAHRGDCSFAGVYQPKLPRQSESFGEFIAFSNFRRIWDFLDLPERASIQQLENATQYACSMSLDETLDFNDGRVDDDVDQYCFRSVYALNVLRGYGFKDTDHITAITVINGHKVGWAIGSIIYEINTLPWEYEKPDTHVAPLDTYHYQVGSERFDPWKWEAISVFALLVFAGMLFVRRHNSPAYREYQPIKEVSYQQNVQLDERLSK